MLFCNIVVRLLDIRRRSGRKLFQGVCAERATKRR